MTQAKPKIIFWGSPDFSLPALAVCKTHGELLGVVTQPDKARGRGHDLLPTPVKAWAQQENLPVFSPKSLRNLDAQGEALLKFLADNPADYFVVVAYGNLLPDSVLALPRRAPVNIHASLLPRWRGAAPIQRALEAGDTETGVSLQRMVKELDAGDVYLEKTYQIRAEDNAKTLFEKLSTLGAELLADFLQRDFSGLHALKQDPTHITLAAKISKTEALWRTGWTAREFHDKVRAFSAWPVVKIIFQKGTEKLEIKVTQTALLTGNFAQAWGIDNHQAYVRGSDGNFVQIVTAQLPGKGPSAGAQALSRLEKDGFQLVSA